MSRRLIALVAFLVGGAAASAQGDAHTFQVVDGEVYVDGTHLPEAVPAGLDLSGLNSDLLQFQDPNLPVIEVGGQVYVLENRRLIPFEQSSKAGQGVYMLYPSDETVAGIPAEQTSPILEAAYMREMRARDRTLYERLQMEERMENDALFLAERVRSLPEGPERDRLRSDLRDLLSELLALKHAVRAAEIEDAQDRLDALRARLDEREEQHDEIVEVRLRQLCGDE